MEMSPMTVNRAATAVVRSRICLERAQEELRLALSIVTQSEDPVAMALDPPERLALMERLESSLGRVQAAWETTAAIWDGSPNLRIVASDGRSAGNGSG